MTQDAFPFVPGGTYFFTVRLQDARSDLLVRHIDLLRDATRLCRKSWPFTIPAAVVLPSQLHMIWALPDGDAEVSKRWRIIKSGFSRHIPAPAHLPESHARRGDKGIWQRGFWEHLIRDRDDFERHAHLIRAAPVQARLVKRASEWPYSSLHYRLHREVRTTAPVPSSPDPATGAMTTQTAGTVASRN